MKMKKYLLKILWVLYCLVLISIGYYLYQKFMPTRGGVKLNQAAWEASYLEYGNEIPQMGPREGYWGARINPEVPNLLMHHHERKVHFPGLVETDEWGIQHYSSGKSDELRILIVGGSVAFGAYASDISHTYFARLAETFNSKGYPVDITVLAAGGWTSFNELAALRFHGPRLRPQVVIFVNGLNDLTQINRESSFPIKGYIENMQAARSFVKKIGASQVVVLQPLLAGKTFKSKLESEILLYGVNPADRKANFDWVAQYRNFYDDMKSELKQKATEDQFLFIDCSAAFNSENKTVFSDFWHFSDKGHQMLSNCIEREMTPLVFQLSSRLKKIKSN